MYLLHSQYHESVNNLIKERVQLLTYKQTYNQKITLDTIWDGIEIGMNAAANSLENFAKEIPGLNEIEDTVDFRVLINNRLFDYLMVSIFLSYIIST